MNISVPLASGGTEVTYGIKPLATTAGTHHIPAWARTASRPWDAPVWRGEHAAAWAAGIAGAGPHHVRAADTPA